MNSALRLRLVVLTGLAAAVLTAACDGGGGNGGTPTITSFTASPAVLPLPGGPVTFAWKVSGASSLEIQPYVGAVTGTAKTMTLSSSNTFTLIAHNKNGASVATTSVLIGGPMTVTGRVLSDAGPVASAPVVVLGQPSTPVGLTDTDGRFSIANVVPPYDIAFVGEGVPALTVVYRGLTRPDPTLFMMSFSGGFSANVTGKIAGGTGFPESANVETAIGIRTTDGGARQGTASASDGSFSLIAAWSGHASSTASLHAVEYHTGAHGPDAFVRTGSRTVSGLLNNVAVPGSDIAMTTIANTATMSGSFTHAAQDNCQYVHAGTTFSPGSSILAAESVTYPGYSSTNGTFSLLTPQIPNTQAAVLFQCGTASGNGSMNFGRVGLVGNETDVKITIPAVPAPITPPIEAIVGHDTLFAWEAPPQSVTALVFVDTNPSPGPALAIVQSATDTTVSAIPETGFDFVPGHGYFGLLFTPGPFATVDDATGPGGVFAPAGNDAFLGQAMGFAVVASQQP